MWVSGGKILLSWRTTALFQPELALSDIPQRNIPMHEWNSEEPSKASLLLERERVGEGRALHVYCLRRSSAVRQSHRETTAEPLHKLVDLPCSDFFRTAVRPYGP